MVMSRYSRAPRLAMGAQQGVSEAVMRLRAAIRDGSIPIAGQIVVTGNDRLDTIAGVTYGDARYWWVLAAASDIGWGMQVPPGTVLNVIDIKHVSRFGS